MHHSCKPKSNKLITNYLVRLDQPKNQQSSSSARDKENHPFKPPSTSSAKTLRLVLSRYSRSAMLPSRSAGSVASMGPQQQRQRVIPKRGRYEDTIVLSSDSDSSEASPKRLCTPVRNGGRGRTTIRNQCSKRRIVAISYGVKETVRVTIDQEAMPRWLRDPTDDEESGESDGSLVSSSAVRRISAGKSSIQTKPSCSSPISYPSPSSPTAAATPEEHTLTADAFQKLSVDDTDTQPHSPTNNTTFPDSPPSSPPPPFSPITPSPLPLASSPVKCVQPLQLDVSSFLTQPPYLKDVQLLLWERGLHSMSERNKVDQVHFFIAHQENMVLQLLTPNLFPLHKRILNVVEYLQQIAHYQYMLQSNLLTLIWSSAMELDDGYCVAGNAAARVFGMIVTAYPPHLHPSVRRQYQLFLQELNSHGLFSLWQHLSDAIDGPIWKVTMASAVIDMLLVDYYGIHTGGGAGDLLPLFHMIFWQGGCVGTSRSVTQPVRQLMAKLTTGCVLKNPYTMVSCCYSLMFLVATACHKSVVIELFITMGNIPPESLSTAITRLSPGPLQLSLLKLFAHKLPLAGPVRQILDQVITMTTGSPGVWQLT